MPKKNRNSRMGLDEAPRTNLQLSSMRYVMRTKCLSGQGNVWILRDGQHDQHGNLFCLLLWPLLPQDLPRRGHSIFLQVGNVWFYRSQLIFGQNVSNKNMASFGIVSGLGILGVQMVPLSLIEIIISYLNER